MIFTNFALEHILYLIISMMSLLIMWRRGVVPAVLVYFIGNAIYFGLREPFQIMTYPGGFQAAALYTLPAMIFLPVLGKKMARTRSRTLAWVLLFLGLSTYITPLYIQPSFAQCIGMLCLGGLIVLESCFAFVLLLALVPTLFMHGSTSKIMYGILFIGWVYHEVKKPLVLIAPFILGLIAAIIYTTKGLPLLGGGERINQWTQAMDYFFHGGAPTLARYLFGFGAGSYTLLGGAIQGYEGTFFCFLHNDILQILFEYGFMGFCLFHAMLAFIFWKLKKPTERALILAAYTFMFFYFPLHFTASLVALVVCVDLLIGGRRYEGH